MFVKALLASVFIVFIGVQFATSLECYTCNGPNDCRHARLLKCTNETANMTSLNLRNYHQNVPLMSSKTFQCVSLRYTFPNNKSISYQLHGCIHPNVGVCSLHLMPQYASWRKSVCHVCSKDKCNKNPAGKMSSSVYTIAATVIGIMLTKIYA